MIKIDSSNKPMAIVKKRKIEKRFAIRKPFSIFKRIKNAVDEEKKEKLNQLLEALRKEMPKGFKIGAAVYDEDCFFDSVAQGLNALKDKGLSISSKEFSVKSLRESCMQYAQINQSKKHSWLGKALKGEHEKLSEYISRIEFTAEDIKNASSYSAIAILKLENAIWGRPEVEGKMICKTYGVKIRVIKLIDEAMDGLHVTKSKVGKGSNIINIVNYRNHFVPLLHNINRDIKKSIKVSKEEAYGNLISSNSKSISQSNNSIPLRNIENYSHKQSSHSGGLGKGEGGNCVMGRKREHSVTSISDTASKKMRLDLDDTSCYPSQITILKEQSAHEQDDCIFDFKKQNISRSSNTSNLESETAKGNYTYWLSDQDIRKIADIEYNDLYDIHNFSNNYENSAKGFAVISYQYLDFEIVQFKDIFHDDSDAMSLRTFIINLGYNHWVTLVVSRENGHYCGYYIDSLYNKGSADHERNKIPDCISNILTKRGIEVKDLKIHQLDDSHNCGLFALENAKDINDVLRGSYIDEDEMFHRLQFPRDNYYFIERRDYLMNKLKGGRNQKKSDIECTTANVLNDSPEEVSKQAMADGDGKLPRGLNYSYDGLYEYDENTFAKMCGYFTLFGIAYHLQLLMFCFYRAFVVHKYDKLSLAAEEVKMSKFDDVVLYYKNKAICIQIKHIDVEKSYNSIGFAELFPSGNRRWKGMFSINKYFKSFTQYEGDDIEYLVLYTNTCLNLTEEKRLSKPRLCVEFFPLEFNRIDIEEEKYKILKDCLYTGDSVNEHDFYQFSHEKTTRKELLKLIDIPSTGVYNEKDLKRLKKNFLDKLILAVNQPSRENLNSIIKHEIEKNSDTCIVSNIYNKLYEGMLNYLKNPIGIYVMKKHAKKVLQHTEKFANLDEIFGETTKVYRKTTGLRNHIPYIMYKLELLMLFFYRMYQRKDDELLISSENSIVNISSSICLHYKDKVTYVWIRYGSDGYINYSMLFSNDEKTHFGMLYINRYFINFIRQLGTHSERIEYLVIYTNMRLNLTEEGNLEETSIRFNSIDIKECEILRNYLCTDYSTKEYDFYQFLQEKATRRQLFKLLDTRPFNYDTSRLKEMKKNFLSRLVFAVNQPDREKLSSIIKYEIGKNDEYIPSSEVICKYISLREVVLRWLGCNKVHYIGRKKVAKLFKDIKNNKSSNQKTNVPNVYKDQFVRTIVADRGLCHFRQLREFLDTKEGENMFNVLCKNRAEQHISGMLCSTGIGIINVFRQLYYMLFCKDGNRTEFLKSLIESDITLGNVSSMLRRSGNKAPEALEALHVVLNTRLDNGKTYLEFFTENNVMRNISGMLNGAGCKAPKALETLQIILNTKLHDGKTYLEFFVEKNIIGNISSMLSGTEDGAPVALQALYAILNTKLDDGKTYLEFFTENNIIGNISSMLSGVGNKAPEALEALYTVLNTKLDDGKTYLEYFVEKNILGNISSMLSKAKEKASDALKVLFTVLNAKLNNGKTYLEFFVEKNIMVNISSILHGTGRKAPETLKELFTILSTKLNNGKTYLEFFVQANIIGNISSMLHGSRDKAPRALKALYNVLNMKLNDEKTYLEFFVEKNVVKNLSSILNGAGDKAPEALKELCTILNMKLCDGKTYLEFFVETNIMKNISSMLSGVGNKAAEALKELCAVLSTKLDDGKTYLEFFVENNIMKNISNILHGARDKSPKILKALYSILRTKLENGKTYLEFFVEKNIMENISNILGGARQNACRALKKLHTMLNTKLDGGKTYLEVFVENNIMKNISSMLSGAGDKAPEAVKKLFTILNTKFEDGKTYLEFFVEKKVMKNISSMLSGAGSKAPEALKELFTILNTKLDDGKT